MESAANPVEKQHQPELQSSSGEECNELQSSSGAECNGASPPSMIAENIDSIVTAGSKERHERQQLGTVFLESDSEEENKKERGVTTTIICNTPEHAATTESKTKNKEEVQGLCRTETICPTIPGAAPELFDTVSEPPLPVEFHSRATNMHEVSVRKDRVYGVSTKNDSLLSSTKERRRRLHDRKQKAMAASQQQQRPGAFAIERSDVQEGTSSISSACQEENATAQQQQGGAVPSSQTSFLFVPDGDEDSCSPRTATRRGDSGSQMDHFSDDCPVVAFKVMPNDSGGQIETEDSTRLEERMMHMWQRIIGSTPIVEGHRIAEDNHDKNEIEKSNKEDDEEESDVASAASSSDANQNNGSWDRWMNKKIILILLVSVALIVGGVLGTALGISSARVDDDKNKNKNSNNNNVDLIKEAGYDYIWPSSEGYFIATSFAGTGKLYFRTFPASNVVECAQQCSSINASSGEFYSESERDNCSCDLVSECLEPLEQNIIDLAKDTVFSTIPKTDSCDHTYCHYFPNECQNSPRVLPYICAASNSTCSWKLLGSSITGGTPGEASGSSVSLSDSGTALAIGSPGNDDQAVDGGQARVYDWDGSTWRQRGQDIYGQDNNSNFGKAVTLSGDGNTLAAVAPQSVVGETNSGGVYVYHWDDSQWRQRGHVISGTTGGNIGNSIELSFDGTVLLLKANANDGVPSIREKASVYYWTGQTWIQLGSDFKVENAGYSVTLSRSGETLALGNFYDAAGGSSRGSVTVYGWAEDDWNQIGSVLKGTHDEDFFGASVSLSADGKTVAVGATQYGSSFGYVAVFTWGGDDWTMLGSLVRGDSTDDAFGVSVSLSKDGRTIAIGASGHDRNAGSVEVYDWSGSSWLPRGRGVNGEAGNDLFGDKISLAADGFVFAAGARGADSSTGHVRVYQWGL